VQLAPFKQGSPMQSSMFNKQVSPVKPKGQLHIKLVPFINTVHDPLFSQGFGKQGEVISEQLSPIQPVKTFGYMN